MPLTANERNRSKPRFKFILFLLCIFYTTAYGQTPDWLWAHSMEGTGTGGTYVGVSCKSVVADASGNFYSTGYFSGILDFDPGPAVVNLPFSYAFDLFVKKTDAAGNLVWAKSMGSTNSEVGSSIAVDPINGNICVTGYFSGTVDFDPGPGVFNLTTPVGGGYFLFICKLDSLGNFIWAKSLLGTPGLFNESNDIKMDAAGNVYVTGGYQGTCDFDPGPAIFNLTSAGSTDIFICKLDQAGNFIWAKGIGATSGETCRALGIGNSGSIILTGYFSSSTVDFDPGPGVFNLNSIGLLDVFILKLDNLGSLVWAGRIGGNDADEGNSLVVDTSAGGGIYYTGYFRGTCDFDPGPGELIVPTAGGDEVFVSKLDLNGGLIWARQFMGPNNSGAKSILLDPTIGGGVYTVGYTNGTVDFDPGAGVYNLTASPPGQKDIFISKLDVSGNFLWAKVMGGSNDDNFTCIARSPSGVLNICGESKSPTLAFGTHILTITSTAPFAGFLARLDNPVAPPLAAITAGGPTSFCNPPNTVTLSANTGAGLSYQWRKDNVIIPGAFSSAYVVTTSGNYECLVSNGTGSAISNAITVNAVTAPPTAVITASGFTNICSGDSTQLVANAGLELTYQWRLNGVNIPGKTNRFHHFKNPGNYDCVVTNICGSTISNSITITVITSPPAAITAAGPTSICQSGSVTLNANITAGIYYQWRLNGTDITGATSASYVASVAGNYTCNEINSCFMVLSNSIAVTVNGSAVSFQKAIGGGGSDVGRSLIRTSDGGYAIVGLYDAFGIDSGSVYVIKLNGSGAVQWTKAIGQQSYDEGFSIVQTADGGYAVTGKHGHWTFDMYVIKLDAIGNLVWSSTINEGFFDLGTSIIETSDGGLLIGGRAYNGFAYYGLLVKLSASGSFQWSQAYGQFDDGIYSVVQTFDGGYALAAMHSSPPNGMNLCLVKTDAAGTLQWQRSVGGAGSEISAKSPNMLVQSKDSGFVITGTTNSFGAGGNDIYVVKFSITGSLLWTRTIGGSGDEDGSSVIQTADLSYTIAGSTNSFGSGGWDAFLAGLNSAGVLQWSRAYGGTGSEGANDVVPSLNCGGFVFTGSTTSFGNGSGDVYVVETDANATSCMNTTVVNCASGTGGTLSSNFSNAFGSSTNVVAISSSINPAGAAVSVCSTSCTLPVALISSGGSTTVCPGNSVTLNAVTGLGLTNQWRKDGNNIAGAIASSYSAATSGIFSCVISNSCGSTSSNSISVVVLPAASITAGGSTTICQGNSVVLNANPVSGATYAWYRNTIGIGVSTSSLIVTQPGDYKCNYTYSCGSSMSNIITVTVLSLATITQQPIPAFVCAGGNTSFSVTATGTGLAYQWQENGLNISNGGVYSGATSATLTLTGVPSNYDLRQYRCVVTGTCSPPPATSNAAALSVGAVSAPAITITGPTSFCAGASVNYQALPQNAGLSPTYQWKKNGVVVATNLLTWSTNSLVTGDVITCTLTTNDACSQASAVSNPITVSIIPLPTAVINAAGPTSFCIGRGVGLSANTGAGLTYQWKSNGANISGATSSAYNASVGASYTCLVTNACGSTTSNAIIVTLLNPPSANITAHGSTSICPGSNVKLVSDTAAGVRYQWMLNGIVLPAETLYQVAATAAGSYTCEVSNICDTLISNAIAVTLIPMPSADIYTNDPTAFCSGSTAKLNLITNNGQSFQWQLGGVNIAGATGLDYTTGIAGNYTCVVTGPCGSTTSNMISLTVNATPTASITTAGSTTFCAGGSVTLNANTGAGLTHQWKLGGTNIIGATASSYNATAAGNYTCLVSNTCGGTTSNSITVTISPLPTATITAGGSTSICQGSSVTLNANTGAGLTHQWKLGGNNITGATASSYNATAAGSYSCIVTNGCGSATSNSITVTISPLPTATITAAGSTTICTGGSVTLNANTGTGLTYQWKRNGTNISGATASSYNATTTGSYTCAVTNSCGSATSNTIAVTSGTAPSTPSNISGNNKACPSSTEIYSVTAVSGVTYNWTAPAAATILSGQGTYTVTVSFASNFNSGTLSVTASNTCGTSSARTKSISKNNRCGAIQASSLPSNQKIFDAVVYPNPASDHFTITILTQEQSNCRMVVHDLTGRVVEQMENISPGESVEFGRKLSSGVYLVEVIQGEERKVLRVVKNQ